MTNKPKKRLYYLHGTNPDFKDIDRLQKLYDLLWYHNVILKKALKEVWPEYSTPHRINYLKRHICGQYRPTSYTFIKKLKQYIDDHK